MTKYYLRSVAAILFLISVWQFTKSSTLKQAKSSANNRKLIPPLFTTFNQLATGYGHTNLFLDELKNKTTSEVADIVLRNCRLTGFRPEIQMDKNLTSNLAKEAFRDTKNKNETIRVCLNTKSASSFMRKFVLNKSAEVEKTNYFMVIREPMHRLLSAYLNKLRHCRSDKCKAWRRFVINIGLYVKHMNKVESNLFKLDIRLLHAHNVTFPDFVDYCIHMFLQNKGRIAEAHPEVRVQPWVWWHWMSVVEHCDVCHVAWKDVVLFENLAVHLDQVKSKYPQLFKDDIPFIRTSFTDSKLKLYFDQLDDEQLRFLGNVMYSVDYAILPYKFQDFLKSIDREI